MAVLLVSTPATSEHGIQLVMPVSAAIEGAQQPTSMPASQPASLPALSPEQRAWGLLEEPFTDLIWESANVWKVDPWILLGLLWAESRLYPEAVNKVSRASGIAQFTKTGRKGLNTIRCMRLTGRMRCDLGDHEFTPADTFDPEKAVPAAAELLSYLTNRWGPLAAVKHYNGGPYKHHFADKVLQRTEYYRMTTGMPPLCLQMKQRSRPKKSSQKLPVS